MMAGNYCSNASGPALKMACRAVCALLFLSCLEAFGPKNGSESVPDDECPPPFKHHPGLLTGKALRKVDSWKGPRIFPYKAGLKRVSGSEFRVYFRVIHRSFGYAFITENVDRVKAAYLWVPKKFPAFLESEVNFPIYADLKSCGEGGRSSPILKEYEFMHKFKPLYHVQATIDVCQWERYSSGAKAAAGSVSFEGVPRPVCTVKNDGGRDIKAYKGENAEVEVEFTMSLSNSVTFQVRPWNGDYGTSANSAYNGLRFSKRFVRGRGHSIIDLHLMKDGEVTRVMMNGLESRKVWHLSVFNESYVTYKDDLATVTAEKVAVAEPRSSSSGRHDVRVTVKLHTAGGKDTMLKMTHHWKSRKSGRLVRAVSMTRAFYVKCSSKVNPATTRGKTPKKNSPTPTNATTSSPPSTSPSNTTTSKSTTNKPTNMTMSTETPDPTASTPTTKKIRSKMSRRRKVKATLTRRATPTPRPSEKKMTTTFTSRKPTTTTPTTTASTIKPIARFMSHRERIVNAIADFMTRALYPGRRRPR